MVRQNTDPRLYHRCATLCLVATVLLIPMLCIASSNADNPPTIDDIRAAWDKQNTANISVRFVQDRSRALGDAPHPQASITGDKLEFAYVRTPEMVYQKDWRGWEQSAERAEITRLGDGRKIEIFGGKGMLKVNGKSVQVQAGDKTRVITDGPEIQRTWGMGGMETILYRTYGRNDDPKTDFLYGWLKYAKVAEQPEEISGHNCWKLDITDTGEGIVNHLQIWIDPTIGCCPRKICTEGVACGAKRGDIGQFKIETEFSAYTEITKGIWFPGKIVMVLNQANAYAVNATTVWTLNEVLKDKSFVKKEVMVKFNPGDTVYRLQPQDTDMKKCTVTEDGSIVPVAAK